MSIVTAPLPGTVLALAEVPDPVFAQGMVGAGAAIEPPAHPVEVVAPISGRLVKFTRTPSRSSARTVWACSCTSGSTPSG